MFYDNFLTLCTQRGVTPSAVMRAIGLNKSSATYWKKGSLPSSDTLQKLAEYFGVSVDYLLGKANTVDGCTFSDGTGYGGGNGSGAGFGDGTGYDGPITINQGAHLDAITRINRNISQMTQEGQEKVAGYVEDILPRYRAETAPQSPPASQEGKDTTPPPDAPETPPEGK